MDERAFVQSDAQGDIFKFPLPAYFRSRKYISQHFGANPQAYAQWGAGHAGTDIAVPQGTPVYSARTGQVVACRTDAKNPAKYLGLYVIVQSADNRYQDLYAHLSAVQVKNGATVASGDKIGVSGSTGNSTGPHLHFGERPLPRQDNGYRGFVNAEALLFPEAGQEQDRLDSLSRVQVANSAVPDNAGNVDAALGPGAAAPSRRRLRVHAPSLAMGAPAWIVLAYVVLQVLVSSGVNPGFNPDSLRQLEGVVRAVADVEGVPLPDVPDVPVATAPTSAPTAGDDCLASQPALDRFNIHTDIEGPVSGYGTDVGTIYCIVAQHRSDANHVWYELRAPSADLPVGYVRAMADNGVKSFAGVGDP